MQHADARQNPHRMLLQRKLTCTEHEGEEGRGKGEGAGGGRKGEAQTSLSCTEPGR